MGQGQAKLTDALDVSKRELANANARCQALEAQIAMLKSEVTQAAQTLQKEGQAHEQLVDSYDAELSKAVKQRQLAEELRRSDALLAKRIMCAQRLAQEVSAPEAGSVMADGPITAQFALAAQDEIMLRKMLLQVGTQLESARSRARTLEQALNQRVRQELCDSVWLAKNCDVSLVVRSTDFTVLGGLRMPHQSQAQLVRSISPGLAVLRYFGDSSMQGPWMAAGGSLLFDWHASKVSSLRVGLAARPAHGQAFSVGFDEKGFLSSSFNTALADALSLQISGKADLNRRQRPSVRLQFNYDLD